MPPRIPLAQSAPMSMCSRVIALHAAAGSSASSTAFVTTASASSSSLLPRSSPPLSSSLTSLFGALSLQTRKASILAKLSDNPGAYSKRIRKGRGPSSGYGKTSGRGHKGQKQHGSVRSSFQGGQTPLVKTWGIKGFVNHRAPVYSEVNLDTIQQWIDSGRIDPTKQITPKELLQSGIVGRPRDGVKLLARGGAQLRTPIDIVTSRASRGAIEAIEAAGGKVLTRYYTKQAIKRLVRGESVHTTAPLPVGARHIPAVLAERRRHGRHVYRLPDPTSREDIEYYRDPAHRGYLSHLLAPGESPSLYFKVPGERKSVVQSAAQVAKKKALEDNRLF